MPNHIAKPRLVLRGDEPRTTSMAVAEFFGKEHKNVLRDIRRLLDDLEDDEFARLNFELLRETMTYVHADGLPQTRETGRVSHYEMTRDGFALLSMRFTGKKALHWAKRYIAAFNAMEGMLASRETAGIIQMVKEVVAEEVAKEVAKIRAEYAALNATQVAGRLGIPTWSTEGGYLSEAFTLMFFALGHRFTDAALLWTLYDEFDCVNETRTLSAREIVEASGRALCRTTAYMSRQRLIARGLLLNLDATMWRINRELFEQMMRETQLVAHVQRVPVVTADVHGMNTKLAQWIDGMGTKTIQ